jgi:hypothetical protein
MKPTLLGPLDGADLYPLTKEYRLVPANRPNRAGFILLPNDGSRAIFQNISFCGLFHNTHYLAYIISDGTKTGKYYVGKNLERCSCGLRYYPTYA